MANIRFGTIVSDARGKASGAVYSKNRGGSYIRGLVIPTNPRTEAQQAQRRAFGDASAAWNAPGTSKLAWIEAAKKVQVSNKVGDQIVLSGHQYFTRVNTFLRMAGFETVNVPPANVRSGYVQLYPYWLRVTPTGELHDISFTGEVLDASGAAQQVPITGSLMVEATRGISPGTKVTPADYKLVTIAGGSQELAPFVFTEAYNRVFPAPLPGQRVYLSVYMVYRDGSISDKAQESFTADVFEG